MFPLSYKKASIAKYHALIEKHSMSLLYNTKHANVYNGDGLILKVFNNTVSTSMYRNEKRFLLHINESKITNTPQLLDFGDASRFLLMTNTGIDGIDLINDGKMEQCVWDVFVTQIYPTLNDLHASGLVHRDLKPENVTFKDGVWSIIDMGFMELIDSPTTIRVIGTYPYCCPMLGNKWSMNTFLEYNDKSLLKKANDYYGFAVTVLSLKNVMIEHRSGKYVTVDLLSLQRLVVTSEDKVLVTCAKLILAFMDINYEFMTWFVTGKCIFTRSIKEENRVSLDVNRNIEECWGELGRIINEKRKIECKRDV